MKRIPLPEQRTKLYLRNGDYYLINKVCGYGGNAIVYDAIKVGNKRRLAIKECYPNIDETSSFSFVRDDSWNVVSSGISERSTKEGELYFQKVKEAMEHECLIGQEISNRMFKTVAAWEKAEIVAIEIDGKAYSVNNGIYIVMDQIVEKGCFLKDILNECRKFCRLDHPLYTGGNPSLKLVVHIIREIAKTLMTLHRVAYIHGDINFGNIFFTSANLESGDIGEAILLDFGCAQKLTRKSLNYKFTRTEELDSMTVFSTNEFGSPEIRMNKNPHLALCETSDIYSLGCLFFYLLKEQPFSDCDSLRLHSKPIYISSRDIIKKGGTIESVERVNNLLSWALRLNPEERCNAQQMVEALNEIEKSIDRIESIGWKRYTKNHNFRPVTLKPVGGTYVERPMLLNQLDAILHEDGISKHMAFISGFAGDGKSELARAYAYTHKGEYRDIFWLTISEESNKTNTVPSVEDLLQKAEYSISKEELLGLKQDTLIIIDNFNQDNPAFVDELCELTGQAALVFTTRMAKIANISFKYFLKINSDDTEKEETCISIFKKNYELKDRYGRGNTISDSEKKFVKNICRLASYNAMFVSLIAVELRDFPRFTFEEYAEKLGKGLKNIKSEGIKIDIVKDHTYMHSELLEIMMVLTDDLLTYKFSSFEKQLLTVLSWNPALPVSNAFLFNLLGDNEVFRYIENSCAEISRRNWIQDDGEHTVIHPLVAEMLTLKNHLILGQEADSFGEHLIDNWLCLDDSFKKQERFFWESLLQNIPEISEVKKAALAVKMHPSIYDGFFSQKYNTVPIGFYTEIANNTGVRYVLHDSKKNKDIIEIDLANHKNSNPYWNFDGVESIIPQTSHSARIERIILNKPFVISLKIPEQVDGVAVTNLASTVFYDYKRIEAAKALGDNLKYKDLFKNVISFIYKMTIPPTIKRVNTAAFMDSYFIVIGKIVFSDMLESIDSYAFSGFGVIGTLKFKNPKTTIGNNAFEKCYLLMPNLPGEIQEISPYSFRKMVFYRKFSLPNSIRKIGAYAFADSDYGELKDKQMVLKLPAELEVVDDYAFSDCQWVKSINLYDQLQTIGDYSFNGGHVEGDLQFPNSLKRIGAHAFERSGLRKVSFPESLISIGQYAFKDCLLLTSDTIPDCCDETVFEGCRSQKCEQDRLRNEKERDKMNEIHKAIMSGKLTPEMRSYLEQKRLAEEKEEKMLDDMMNGHLTEIDDYLFENSNVFAYSAYALPEGVVSIGNSSFKSSNISGISLPKSLQSIGESAFENVSSLKLNFSEEGLLHIGDKAFLYCDLELEDGILNLPSTLQTIGRRAFAQFIDDSIKKIYFPPSLKYIGDEAFLNNSGIEGELCFNSKLTHIGKRAFNGCHDITALRFPRSLKEIDDNAFEELMSLENIIFSEGLIRIGDEAFMKCSLSKVKIIFPQTLKEIGNRTFKDSSIFGTITLPSRLHKVGDGAFEGTYLKKVIVLNDDIRFGERPFESMVIICCRKNSAVSRWAMNSIPRYKVEYFDDIQN